MQVPNWFKDTFESLGSTFIEKDGEVAADTPWGAGYIPKRKADMNSSQREQVDTLLKRYEDDPDYTYTDASNGTKTIVHTPSGTAINEDNFMLTAGPDGAYEVASMFDIGMMTGTLTEGKANMDIQRAIMGVEAPGENSMAPASSEEPTQEEQDTGKAMLEVDQSGATPPTDQQPGAPVAGPVTEGALPTTESNSFSVTDGQGAETKYDAKEYDIDSMQAAMPNIGVMAKKYLASKGIDENSKEFATELANVSNHLVGQMSDSHKLAVEAPEETGADEPLEEEPETLNQHWTSDTDYKRKVKAQDDYSENYGNYDSSDEYYDALNNTRKILMTSGKRTSNDDKLLARLDSDAQKWHDLGIATVGQLKAYDRDMKDYENKQKAKTTQGYAKAQRDEAKNQVFNEAITRIDKSMDEGGRALDSIDLSRSQARKINYNRKKLGTADDKRMVDIKRKASTVRNIQNMIKEGKLESLEKASPLERGKAWINSYFGDMTEKQRKAMIGKQGMDKLVSDTVKEISGAAASDQERAFISDWLLGKRGMDMGEMRRVMNKIQKQSYEDAQNFGDKLYDQSDIGWVQHLKESVGDLAGMTDEDVIGGK